MSNEIAECTIIKFYVIKIQNGRLDFILRFEIFVRKRELCVSVLCCFDWAATNLLKSKFSRFASLHE